MRFILIGFGTFGKLVHERLRTYFKSSDFIVLDPCVNVDDVGDGVQFRAMDGVVFLAQSGQVQDSDVIVPLAPLNIAAEYVLLSVKGTRRTKIPLDMRRFFRVFSCIDEFTFCVSYADFLCPDDCEEGNVCTVTGESRTPMFQKLRELPVIGSEKLVIRSRQILPGVGGYTFQDLKKIRDSVIPNRKTLICSSCKCHAIISGIIFTQPSPV